MSGNEHEIEERLRRLADGYNRPPPTPKEAMWAAIEARIGRESGGAAGGPVLVRDTDGAPARARRPALRRGMLAAAAAAAVLALGIGIGRHTAAPPGGSARVAEAPEDDVVRAAALDHLGRSEALLAMVRSDARSGRVDPEVARWGRGLLVQTRLLLDSRAGSDPSLRPLLEDLEVILAQVALLSGDEESPGRAREELDIIARGLDENGVLPRIQAVVPAMPGIPGT